MLNQQYPELFVISSDKNLNKDITSEMEKALQKVNSYEELINVINTIDDNKYKQVISDEQTIDKKSLLDFLDNIQYLDIEKNWSILEGIIQYNNFSKFIINKTELIEQLENLSNEYKMKSLSLNPNYNPEDFLNTLKNDLPKLCQVLGIKPEQIGLNVLEVNYQTEEGDFSGYMGYSSEEITTKMVIKKTEVFLHEWIHFVDASLGIKNYTMTDLLESAAGSTYLKKDGLENTMDFKKSLYKKEENYSEKEFGIALSSLGHFLEKYSLDKENYYNNLNELGKVFVEEIKKNNPDAQKELIVSIKKLLNPSHPPRYFSFLNAQCEMLLDSNNKINIINNQMLDFSNKADKHLGEKDYTASLVETFARTAETYFFEKAKEMGLSMKLLANSYESDMYPQGKFKEDMINHWNLSWKEINIKLNEEIEIKNKKLAFTNISQLRNKFSSNNEVLRKAAI